MRRGSDAECGYSLGLMNSQLVHTCPKKFLTEPQDKSPDVITHFDLGPWKKGDKTFRVNVKNSCSCGSKSCDAYDAPDISIIAIGEVL